MYLFIWLGQVLVATHGIIIVACGTFTWGMQTLSCRMWDPILWPVIDPRSPTLEAKNLSHWTIQEVPSHSLCISISLPLLLPLSHPSLQIVFQHGGLGIARLVTWQLKAPRESAPKETNMAFTMLTLEVTHQHHFCNILIINIGTGSSLVAQW